MNPHPELPPRAASGASGWTDERADLAAKLWKDGVSATLIAERLGGVSRNAVIGKLHRMGVGGRHAPARPTMASAPRRPRQPTANMQRLKAARAAALAVSGSPLSSESRPIPMFEEPGDPSSFAPLPEDQRAVHFCRWPIGDPLSPDFGYCGREQGWITPEKRDAYCPDHREAERKRARQAHGPKFRLTPNELMRNLRRFA